MTDEDEGPRTVHLDPSQLPGGERFRAPVIPEAPPRAAEPVDSVTTERAEPGRQAETRVTQVPSEIADYFATMKANFADSSSGPARASAAAPPTPAAEGVRPDPVPATRVHSSVPRAAPAGPPQGATRMHAAVPAGAVPAGAANEGVEPLGPRPPVIRRPAPDRGAVYSSAPTPVIARAAASVPSPPQPERPSWTAEPSWQAYPQRPGTIEGETAPEQPIAQADEQPAKAGKSRMALMIVVVLIVASAIGAGVAYLFGDQILDLIGKLTG